MFENFDLQNNYDYVNYKSYLNLKSMRPKVTYGSFLK